MSPAARILCACLCAVFLLAHGGSAQDAAAPEAGTARDLIIKADEAYNAKRYAEAVAGYQRFLDDFGKSKEAESLLPRVRYNLAAALMQSQKFDAAAEAAAAAEQTKDLNPAQREDLAFWQGVALLQTGANAEAGAALGGFLGKFPQSRRRPDAELLAATSLLASGKNEEAAKAFQVIRQSPKHPHRGRAAVLELHCLIETGRDKEALQLLAEEAPGQAENLTQLATFQTLALGLGERLLEQDRPRDAIRALQVIWPQERLVAHQQKKITETKERLAALDASPQPDVFQRAQLRQVLREVEKELASLEKIPSFDASVRFRMAKAFHAQERYRECALLLDDMLRQMPADAVVENATLSSLQSWLAIERYDKAVETALLFEERFPSSKQLPLVVYLRGTAQQRALDFDTALATFKTIGDRFPSSEQAPRALFMQGFTQLQADRNEEAAATFEEFLEKNPKHELAEAANYWRGSALAFAKKYPEAREVLASHPSKFAKGSMLAEAAFRHAYCAQAMKDFPTAETELKAYLQQFPDGTEANEARILLGDALLTQGKSDEGKEVYGAIPPGAGRWHEEAQFKLAKVLKLEEDHAALRALMLNYLAAYPKSSRAAEALYLIGQSWRQQDQPEEAAEEYWKAITTFGNDPEAGSVEDLFVALSRNYKDDSAKRDYLAALRALREKATAEKQGVLAVRATWALADAVKKSDPVLSGSLLREAAAMARPETTSPRILTDCAEEQLRVAAANPAEAAERRVKAAAIYRDLLKWHPRAMQKDKALAALARMSAGDGDDRAALDYYARLERDTPWSPLVGEAMMARGRHEEQSRNPDRAAEAYNSLLAAKGVPGQVKAEALLALGDLEMGRQRPKIAIPYYQRIYILYGKWRDKVAKAYLRSGQAFELLSDREAARRTYEELVKNEDLANLPEAVQARERLKNLGPGGTSGGGASS